MNRYENFANKQKGYSMVEILVAMLIVPFGLLGVAKFQSNILVAGSETKTRTEALYAAEQKIEELRTFSNSTGYSAITTGNDIPDALPGSNAALDRSWTVTDWASPNYKTVVVDVGWTGSDSESRAVTLTSYLSMANPIESGKLILAGTSPTYVPPPPPDPTADPDPGTNPDPGLNPDPATDPLPDPNPTADPGPTSYTITISGFISYEGNGSRDWSVSVDGSVCDSGSNSSSYNCVLTGIPLSDAPTLTVSLSTTGTVCGSASVNQNFSSSSNFGAQDFIHAQNSSRC